MPVEVVSCNENRVSQRARLNSFGALGTIAHGAFMLEVSNVKPGLRDSVSLYRGRAALHAGRAADVFLKRASVRGQTSLLLGGEKSEPRRAAIIGAAFSRNTSSSL